MQPYRFWGSQTVGYSHRFRIGGRMELHHALLGKHCGQLTTNRIVAPVGIPAARPREVLDLPRCELQTPMTAEAASQPLLRYFQRQEASA